MLKGTYIIWKLNSILKKKIIVGKLSFFRFLIWYVYVPNINIRCILSTGFSKQVITPYPIRHIFSYFEITAPLYVHHSKLCILVYKLSALSTLLHKKSHKRKNFFIKEIHIKCLHHSIVPLKLSNALVLNPLKSDSTFLMVFYSTENEKRETR